MNIVLRVDAGQRMGTGHFMRCLTLADTLAQRGARCVFLCRQLPSHLALLLERHGHGLRSLPSRASDTPDTELAHAAWLGTTQVTDAADSLEALQGQEWDWLIVDHYALDRHWEKCLRQAARRILVIDDLADRQHECDLLLDQNLYHDMQSRYDGKVPQTCQLLLGPRFALLRDEFSRLRATLPQRSEDVKRVLVFFGGVDEHNFTGLALSALSGMARSNLEVDVVLGALHPQRPAIEAVCQRQGYRCHVQTTRMAELMANADLAIGAGGTATWERCSLGLPTLALSTADNQIRQLADAASRGLVYTLLVDKDLQADLALHLEALLQNPALRTLISNQGMAAVDGLGVQRLAARMGCTGIDMRAAQPRDSDALYRWRNHPSIRAVSRNTEEIGWEDHCRWFSSVLADPRRKLLIGEQGGEPAGVVRFDLEEDGLAEVSIYLVPDAALRCRGSDLLQSAEDWVALHCADVRRLHAQVKGSNKRSNGLFMAAGYDIDNTRFSKKLHEL
ncbi:UDP-2,4-diacetamido-2,4,6-trideoxy-beta-L-altropyranose hydrolase [Pseudomonas migulae]|uniref:UDP-2,4-diacetamido-2,4, 6-trideoxy-beta-L-altropyranose hydrolase n=1 Tax=Pseudomonas migulae TaxID=78543 RepID=UPI0037100ACD